tara:strand:- start:2322 stop:4052 length:1731 start_codon:yes stop_codon:yes gene_type:complete
MSVFNRQLFNGGGEVLEVRQTSSQLNPEEFTFFLEYRDGKPVAVRKQTKGIPGNFREDKVIPIQTNLSASGDPKEAFDVMRRNQRINVGINTAFGLGSLLALPEIGTALGLRALVQGARPYVASAASTANRYLNPLKLALKPGLAVAGKKGFQPRYRGNPFSYAYKLNPTGAFNLGILSTFFGGSEAITTPEDVAQSEEGQKIAAEIKELERQSGITGRTSYEAAIKSAIESGDKDQVVILRDKMKELYGEDSPLAEEFLKDPKPESENKEQKQEQDPKEINQPQPEQERPAEPTEEKEVPLLQNKNFLDLMRNIGIKMVETGDIGRGISLGSAEALKEGRAEELLDEERQAELDKIYTQYGLDRRNALDVARAEAIYKQGELEEFQMKENIKTRNDLLNNPDTSSKMADIVLATETSDAAINYLKEARRIVETGDATGVSPIIKEFINKGARLLQYDVDLSPREKAKALLAYVAKSDVKELLGESGRTISNIDRKIAEELVGVINLRSGEADVLEAIDKAIGKYEMSYKKNIGLYNNYENLYRRFELAPPHQLGKSLDETRGQPIAEIKMSDYVQ